MPAVGAEELLPQTGSGPECPPESPNCGNYSLNDMVRVAVNIASFILSIVGSLALLAFIAGGLMLILSAGNSEWVARGKQTLIGAVVGLAIVFTSYMIIQLIFTSLGIEAASGGGWSMSTWFTGKALIYYP